MIRTTLRAIAAVALLASVATPALAQTLASLQSSQMNVCSNYRSLNNDIKNLDNEMGVARATLNRLQSSGADSGSINAARARVEELSNRYMFYQRSLQTIIGAYGNLARQIAEYGGSNVCTLSGS
jgi:ABC-type oligopeptide transport system substrate-binding subunit